jgi:anti-sigma factor RsiW
MLPDKPPENCREIFALLSAYLDLELPPESCHEIETHLAGCEPCIEFAESLRKTIALCHEYAPQEMPEPIGAEAREQLRKAYGRMLDARRAG